MMSAKTPHTFLSRFRVCALSLTSTALLFGITGCQTSVTPLNPSQPPVITEGGSESGGAQTPSAGVDFSGGDEMELGGASHAGDDHRAGVEIAAGVDAGGELMGGEMIGGGGTIVDNEVCDVLPIFEHNSCTACHGAINPLGGLDLVSQGLGQRLVDSPSLVDGCNQLLIDSQNPDRSMILQVIGAGAGVHEGASCDLPMPPRGYENTITDEDRECLTDWVEEIASHVEVRPVADDAPATLESALRKIKTLIHGGHITQGEIDQARSDGISAVIEVWTETEAFEVKMIEFFALALQQKFEVNNQNQLGRIRTNEGHQGAVRLAIEQVIPRTALHLIQTDQDFTTIATTNTWMMSTASLVLHLFPDQSEDQKEQRHFISGDADEIPNAFRRQISQRRWFVGGLTGTCSVPSSRILPMLFGFLNDRGCGDLDRPMRFDDALLTSEDTQDWRLVEMVTDRSAAEEDLIPFYDLRRLRAANTITTRLPRFGYYTSVAFLNQWPTNVDNEFRITVNQALITGLHTLFRATDSTPSQNTTAVDEEHADEGQDCNGCHRLLDPMRMYFAQGYNADYRLPTDEEGQEALFNRPPQASFAYRGITDRGGRVSRFGQNIADHPRFSTAWVQKVCLFANSTPCDEEDEHFIAIRDRFRDQGHRFLPMLIEVLSSPLVTGTLITERRSTPLISITRRDHLCALLGQRLNDPQVCQRRRVASVLGLIPNDDYVRGATDFTQPALSSAFSFAAAQSVCEAISSSVVTRTSDFLPVSDPEGSMEKMVTYLMSIPESNERHGEILGAFQQHYQALRDSNVGAQNALRSVFVMACLSPDVMGVGL